MPVDPARLKDVFVHALARTDPAARAAYLDAECAGDVTLRGRVEALLRASDDPDSLLDAAPPAPPAGDPATRSFDPAGDTVDRPDAPTPSVGDRVGPYKLLERIGEGGMGEVWVADQLEPIRRRVAVKLIKAGMDSRSVLARFEAERQALAVMDHPNIAKVLDAGTTPDGRPYFVMELVKGTPVTAFADARRLTPKQRLELFVPVCQAIQHAHLKGIIHRDIKPSNVLVELHDDRPVVKVIDFGVAKAVGQQLTEKTLYTGFGAVVGTPAYMAPEQATFNAVDVDTRADVYALGVLLYELLAGSPPIERERLKKAALDEVLRIVRDEEPPRPSARLSTSQAKATIAATRGSEPAKLSALMKGELDWIVMKALEKDRARRYETANGFAADIQRYLSGEQVQAVPPSLGYRLRKAYRRNKAAVLVTTAFALLMAAGVAVSSGLAVQARRAEAMAEEKRLEAEGNAAVALANAEMAKANESTWAKVSGQHLEAVVSAEVRSLGLQLDLDLAELRQDARIGLLRLARPMKQDVTYHTFSPPNFTTTNVIPVGENSEFIRLRQFVTAAVLTSGHAYTSLIPPITHDGQAVLRLEVSPDSMTLLSFGADGTARLWDMRTAKPIAVLRQNKEWVVNGGFSTDGKTVFTDDATGVARFWEPTDGKYRAQIERRKNLYTEAVNAPDADDVLFIGNANSISRSACMKIGRDRLLTQRISRKARPDDPRHLDNHFAGPVELWDTATGRLVARLDRPGSEINEFRFLQNGQWVRTVEGASTVVIYSAESGKEVARLAHPAEETVHHLAVSPNGHRIATLTRTPRPGKSDARFLRLWDTETWRANPTVQTLREQADGDFLLWDDDAYAIRIEDVNPRNDVVVYRFGRDEPLAKFNGWWALSKKSGDRVYDDRWGVFDTHTWQRLRPPSGQRYHPDLTRFAEDGRFVYSPSNHTVMDTRTQKDFSVPYHEWSYDVGYPRWGFVAEFGLVSAELSEGVVQLRYLPTACLDISPKALELWAQVAVRGELGAESEFVKWNEETWEKKRQELAAIPAPYPDFPFPGRVATDKLHWLRREFTEATEVKIQLLHAQELLRRSEAMGDRIEAVRWREEVRRRSPEVLPPPREDK